MSTLAETLEFTSAGAPEEVLHLKSQELPPPGPGQVRVRMLAAPINPSDVLYVQGKYGISPRFPAHPGFEGAGIVEASGGGLAGWFMSGRRVSVLAQAGGTWGTHCLTDARTVMPVPKELSDEQAASFFINPATALLMTRHVLKLSRGDWLMQSAAASAVGRMIIRLGGHFGFSTLNIVRRAEQAEELKRSGATAVLVADTGMPPAEFQAKVRELCGHRAPVHAVDPVGGDLTGLMAGGLGRGGRIIIYGSLSDKLIPLSPRDLLVNDLRVESFWLGRAMARMGLIRKLLLIRELSKLHRRGLFAVENFRSYPLQDFAEALRAQHETRGGEKILIRPA